MLPANLDACIAGFEELEALLEPDGDGNDLETPYSFMERLKKPSSGGLTSLGKYLKANLDANLKNITGRELSSDEYLKSIGWVVFHFDLPKDLFGDSAHDTRNWIATHVSHQGEINKIHSSEISSKEALDKTYHAPSLVSEKLKSQKSPLGKFLRRKIWIYQSYPVASDNKRCPQIHGGDLCLPGEQSLDMLCFTPSGAKEKNRKTFLSLCKWDEIDIKSLNMPRTLGALLNENEELAYSKYKNYIDAIFDTEEEGNLLNNPELRCHYYVRIPVFFSGMGQHYLSEVFIAIRDTNGDVQRTIEILKCIVPALKACVTLINSQVAFSVGGLAGRYETSILLHRVLRHDLKNLTSSIEYAARSMKNCFDDKDDYRKYYAHIISALNLYSAATAVDDLYRIGQGPTSISTTELKTHLESSSYSLQIRKCIFVGAWEESYIVPKVTNIALVNLLGNAIKYGGEDSDVEIRCTPTSNGIDFEFLSERKFPEDCRSIYIDSPLPQKIPSRNRGLYITRFILEKQLMGYLKVGEGTDKYLAHLIAHVPFNGG